jgi:cytochrome c551/c552
MKTLNITDHKMVTPSLAKVIVSFTGDIDHEDFRNHVAAKLKGLAAPVANSFKKISAGVAVGFVKANKQVVMPDPKSLKASYRVMAKNVLMSEEDKTLWDVRSGAAGTYLVRRGEEDLSELVQAATYHRNDVPRVANVTIAKAAANELVAYVGDDGSIDHGFALATSDSKVRVLSVARGHAMEVAYEQVVSIYPVDVKKSVQAAVVASLTPAEKQSAIAYYKRLYSYAPDYLQQVIQQINQGTLA